MMKNLHSLKNMNSNLFINSQALKFALFLLFSLFSLNSFSQTPSDTPCGDPAGSELTVGAANTCNNITWGTASTTSYWTPDGTCAGGIFDDAWGWFDATSTATEIIYSPNFVNGTIHLFDAGPAGAPIACSPTAISVACSNIGGNNVDEIITYATTVGNRYRIRIQRVVSNSKMSGQICIYDTVIPPPNDLCANATPLVCGSNFPAETTVGASDIPSGISTGCALGTVGVWYTFTGDGQAWTIASTGIGGFDHEMAIFEGDCSGVTTSIACQDDFFADETETITVNTNTGVIYYVYIAYYLSFSTQTGDFSITATCAPPATTPPNDDPCGGDIAPYVLTVNPDYSCGSTTAGTVDLGTDSGLDACFANGGLPNNDVWFSFVATGTAHKIELLNVSGGTDMVMSVYNGASGCGSIVVGDVIACYDDPDPISEILAGLTAGQTYFVQVFTYFGGASNATFDICVGTPPPPPANDDPCGAVNAPYVLTVNSDLACGVVSSGTVLSALPTGPNGCIGNADDDVWYSFQATSTSHVVQLSNIAGSTIDLNHGIYGPFALAATCSVPVVAASVINCSDLNTSITGSLIPGQFYFVQVYTDTGIGAQDTTFDICVGTPPTVANDNPCTATDLTPSINPDFLCGIVTPGTVEWATDSSVFGCAGSSDDDVWYSFVANSTDNAHSVDLLNISGSTLDMSIGVYDGSSGCGTLVNIACSNSDTTSFPTILGNTYFIQIYTTNGNANPTTTFDICIGTPPPPPFNDEPCGATPLTVDQFCNVSTGSVASATDSELILVLVHLMMMYGLVLLQQMHNKQ